MMKSYAKYGQPPNTPQSAWPVLGSLLPSQSTRYSSDRLSVVLV